MKKQLKSLLADYLKQVLRKPFSTSEILDTYEIAVIYAYTDDRYEALNERLRKNLGVIDTDFGEEFVRILNKLPNFEGFVFRGASLNTRQLSIYENAFANFQAIVEPTFISASKVEAIARMYMRYSTSNYQVLFIIFSLQGKSIEKYSKFDALSGQNEKEIIFRPKTTFEIVDIDKSTELIIITLNEII